MFCSKLAWPTLAFMLAFPKAKMRAYPKETVVAEKFEAIVKLGMANIRMKDFYDLWVMAGRFEFAGPVFAEALFGDLRETEDCLASIASVGLYPEIFRESSETDTVAGIS